MTANLFNFTGLFVGKLTDNGGSTAMKPDRLSTRFLFLQFIFAVILVPLWLAPHLFGQVLTRSYDNRRTGANTAEKILTPANVSGLKKLRELQVDPGDDPRIEAQPLY